MYGDYGRALPAIIQRPTSNVTPARQPSPMQGQPNAQDQGAQSMMALLAMLAASGQMGGQGMPMPTGPAPTGMPVPLPAGPMPSGSGSPIPLPPGVM